MKNYLITVLFTAQAIFSMAQNNTSYIKYHQQCRKAEAYFLAEDTLQCFQTYHKVFSDYDYLFPRDCFIAAQIAHKWGADSLAVQFLMKGIPYGLNPDFISDDPENTYATEMWSLKQSEYWNLLEDQKDTLLKMYQNKIVKELSLKLELMQMIREDQAWRIRNNKWFNRKFRPSLEKDFEVFNQECILFLDSIFKKKGYPGNWLIGTGDSLVHQTNTAAFNAANMGDMVSVMLYHSDSAYLNYGEFLFQEIDKGHIHPRVYAMIRDFNDRHLVKNKKGEKMYYNIWWERTNYTEEEFEAHCWAIGCPTKKHLRALSSKLGKGYDVFWYPFR